ncbi:MAG: rRNA pseudouridine synthase [Candidatus Omnitrophica bacterium]|nr:rRNA pseudouridine synthase [Candidatus Omnitrophota bacterium]
MRLNRFLAWCGVSSRRKADQIIKEGRVLVNGKKVYSPWFTVSSNDTVEFNGVELTPRPRVYFIFHKPKGVTTTVKDNFAPKKVVDFFSKKEVKVFPVGRLDKDSSGLLILTNDGNLCYRLTHPKFQIEKEYLLWVKGNVTKDILDKLKEGIKDRGDFLRVNSAVVVKRDKCRSKLRVVVCEGKKRHLRRLLGRLGFPVLTLKRVRIGNLKLGKLKPGKFKKISAELIYKLTLGNWSKRTSKDN